MDRVLCLETEVTRAPASLSAPYLFSPFPAYCSLPLLRRGWQFTPLPSQGPTIRKPELCIWNAPSRLLRRTFFLSLRRFLLLLLPPYSPCSPASSTAALPCTPSPLPSCAATTIFFLFLLAHAFACSLPCPCTQRRPYCASPPTDKAQMNPVIQRAARRCPRHCRPHGGASRSYSLIDAFDSGNASCASDRGCLRPDPPSFPSSAPCLARCVPVTRGKRVRSGLLRFCFSLCTFCPSPHSSR